MNSLVVSILIVCGGGIGALLRLIISCVQGNICSKKFPVGTLLINLIGSFLMGCLIGLNLSNNFFLFLGTGFLGGFTTFSTVNFQAVSILKNSNAPTKFIWFLSYISITYIGSILLSLLGVFIFGK